MDKYYSPLEVASILNVSPRTILNWIKKGELEALKVGRTYRISEANLNIFLKKENEK